MTCRKESTLSKRSENLDAQITALESEIQVLQQRWKPYARVQPGRPNTNGAFGPVYHPERFLEKSAIALALDGKMIELARLQCQQAEQVLGDYKASGELDRAEAAYEAAGPELDAARATYEVAQATYQQAHSARATNRERHDRYTKDVVQAEADERRWTKELERDRQLEANVVSRMPGKVA